MKIESIREKLSNILIESLKNSKKKCFIETVILSLNELKNIENTWFTLNLTKEQTEAIEQNFEFYLLDKLEKAQNTGRLKELKEIEEMLRLIMFYRENEEGFDPINGVFGR